MIAQYSIHKTTETDRYYKYNIVGNTLGKENFGNPDRSPAIMSGGILAVAPCGVVGGLGKTVPVRLAQKHPGTPWGMWALQRRGFDEANLSQEIGRRINIFG